MWTLWCAEPEPKISTAKDFMEILAPHPLGFHENIIYVCRSCVLFAVPHPDNPSKKRCMFSTRVNGEDFWKAPLQEGLKRFCQDTDDAMGFFIDYHGNVLSPYIPSGCFLPPVSPCRFALETLRTAFDKDYQEALKALNINEDKDKKMVFDVARSHVRHPDHKEIDLVLPFIKQLISCVLNKKDADKYIYTGFLSSASLKTLVEGADVFNIIETQLEELKLLDFFKKCTSKGASALDKILAERSPQHLLPASLPSSSSLPLSCGSFLSPSSSAAPPVLTSCRSLDSPPSSFSPCSDTPT